MKGSLRKYLRAYLRHRPLFLSMIRAKELEIFERYARLEGRVLDFGCGDGFFARILVRSAPSPRTVEIIGFEANPDKAEEARRTGIYAEVVLSEGRLLPFQDAHFDAIIANCVLEHVIDLEVTLQEIRRVLAPGKKLFCTVMTDKWEDYLYGTVIFGHRYRSFMRKVQMHTHLLTHGEWRRLFEEAQFAVEGMYGYLDQDASRCFELLHYLAAHSLISKRIAGRWVSFPRRHDMFPSVRWAAGLIENDVPADQAAALFFALRKE